MKYFFSFDDGHPEDLKLSDWLFKKKFQAIFYIPIKNSEGLPVLSTREIKELSKNFEIGTHTYNHIDLTTIDFISAKKEIVDGKNALEDIIGKPVKSFAPPRGHYNQEIIKICQSLGFNTFRTARLFNINPSNPNEFIWHPNLHLYPHSLSIDLLHSLKQHDLRSLSFRIRNLSKHHLDLVNLIDNLEPVHLWGHSWEINNLNLKLDNLIND